MALDNWIAFCAIALLATATPGQAALLVSVNSISYGLKKAYFTIVGNLVGLFIMSSFSVMGLTAIVMHSAIMFTIVKVVGAGYLIFMGYKLWRCGVTFETKESSASTQNNAKLFFHGVLIAVTNPKAIVFTTALFPQFIDVNRQLLPQFSILVVSFMGLSFICLSCFAFIAHKTSAGAMKLFSGKTFGKTMGTAFMGSGAYLAASTR